MKLGVMQKRWAETLEASKDLSVVMKKRATALVLAVWKQVVLDMK